MPQIVTRTGEMLPKFFGTVSSGGVTIYWYQSYRFYEAYFRLVFRVLVSRCDFSGFGTRQRQDSPSYRRYVCILLSYISVSACIVVMLVMLCINMFLLVPVQLFVAYIKCVGLITDHG